MDYEQEDISECLANLFLDKLQFVINSFYTAKKNEALIVNKFVYHRKTSKDKPTGVARWVCNVKKCSASLSSLNSDIVKINEAYNLRVDKRSTKHPNVWIFIELIQKEELHVAVKYERIQNGTIKQRSRKGKDVDRDLAISNAKNTYLQSDQQIEDVENLLNSVKLLVQQF